MRTMLRTHLTWLFCFLCFSVSVFASTKVTPNTLDTSSTPHTRKESAPLQTQSESDNLKGNALKSRAFAQKAIIAAEKATQHADLAATTAAHAESTNENAQRASLAAIKKANEAEKFLLDAKEAEMDGNVMNAKQAAHLSSKAAADGTIELKEVLKSVQIAEDALQKIKKEAENASMAQKETHDACEEAKNALEAEKNVNKEIPSASGTNTTALKENVKQPNANEVQTKGVISSSATSGAANQTIITENKETVSSPNNVTPTKDKSTSSEPQVVKTETTVTHSSSTDSPSKVGPENADSVDPSTQRPVTDTAVTKTSSDGAIQKTVESPLVNPGVQEHQQGVTQVEGGEKTQPAESAVQDPAGKQQEQQSGVGQAQPDVSADAKEEDPKQPTQNPVQGAPKPADNKEAVTVDVTVEQQSGGSSGTPEGSTDPKGSSPTGEGSASEPKQVVTSGVTDTQEKSGTPSQQESSQVYGASDPHSAQQQAGAVIEGGSSGDKQIQTETVTEVTVPQPGVSQTDLQTLQSLQTTLIAELLDTSSKTEAENPSIEQQIRDAKAKADMAVKNISQHMSMVTAILESTKKHAQLAEAAEERGKKAATAASEILKKMKQSTTKADRCVGGQFFIFKFILILCFVISYMN